MERGRSNNDTPKISPMFALFEPMIFPNANPDAFSSPPKKETTISGNDVPMATIVTPIMNGGIFVKAEIRIALEITPLLPKSKSRRPKIKKKSADIRLLYLIQRILSRVGIFDEKWVFSTPCQAKWHLDLSWLGNLDDIGTFFADTYT